MGQAMRNSAEHESGYRQTMARREGLPPNGFRAEPPVRPEYPADSIDPDRPRK
jgi:hypothetical protein